MRISLSWHDMPEGRYIAGVLADLTGRERSEAAARDAEGRREPRRAEETPPFAREQSEQGASSKSDFLAMMSHELRTPMNGVLGMTDLLSSTTLTDEQREYVEIIRRSGQALLGLID